MSQNKIASFLPEAIRLLIVILSWVVGIFFVLVGLVDISNKSMLSGFIIFFAGSLFLPIVKKEINNKFKTNIKPKYFNVLAFILLFCGLSISPKVNNEKTQEITKPQVIESAQVEHSKPQDTSNESISSNKKIDGNHTKQDYDAALSYFKGKSEPNAKDAVWTSKKMFKVGVSDDGTNRDGYAEYVCMKLNDFGFRDQGIFVQIIDYDKLMKTEDWVKLGMAQCS